MIGEIRASRRGRKAAYVDIVLDGDRNAKQRQIAVAVRLKGLRLRKRLRFVKDRNENRRIVERPHAGIAARHDLGRRRNPGPIGGRDLDNGFDVTGARSAHLNHFSGVMAGLVPVIHVLLATPSLPSPAGGGG